MTADTQLHELAHLYGVLTAYYDISGREQQASEESLLAVLKSMGAPLSTIADAPSAIQEKRLSYWRQMLEPVIVVWEAETSPVQVKLPSYLSDASLAGHLELENGEWRRWKWSASELPTLQTTDVDGEKYVSKGLPSPGKIPSGYHRFILEAPGKTSEAMVIAAPQKAYQNPASCGWGAFLPLYALHSRTSWGSGDFSDLENLATWVSSLGGNVVATLPFLAALSDELSSPYTPVSRLMWNEFYIDVTKAPEMEKCPAAQSIIGTPSFHDEIESIRKLPLVDYPRQMALKRRVLEELSRCFFSGFSDNFLSFQRFTTEHPEVEEYARFRAAGEKHGISWRSWPELLRQGTVREGDYNEEARRYHLYAQWLASRQLDALSEKAHANSIGLYFDLPLGVHPDGYDVWRNQELFVEGASAGAPPDSFFIHGQNWQFPPMHPQRLRAQNYQYFIASLAHNLRYASILRLDHVMSLHRLFWVPKGMEAKDGVYVRYPAEELYALLTLESQRNEAVIVGEDLGTVPPEVRPAMSRHGLQRMYIVQYEIDPNDRSVLRPIEPNMVAGLNTHDMPPFAAFWQGLDIEERARLGLLSETDVRQEQEKRRALLEALARFLQNMGWEIDSSKLRTVLMAITGFLGRGQAYNVLVNLEDLWLETQPQNTPGTCQERPNWRRKARYSLEEFTQLPDVKSLLHETDRQRKQGSVENGSKRQ
ncbi:MAG: 4-alpha-glucanotransferase [Chloroflexi bacterium]|nr:4-alpha-glucanotransferase [Chloroflexota bacterium]